MQPESYSCRCLPKAAARRGPCSAVVPTVLVSKEKLAVMTCHSNQRRGAAAVEFAFVLPILVTVVLGMADFGRVYYSAISIANAARAGAAYGSMNPFDSSSQSAWQTSVQQAVLDELSQSTAFDLSKVTVTVNSVAEAGGLSRVSVQVTYPYQTLVSWSFIPSSVTLDQTVVMRVIR